jgi:ADP-ribosylglycohydrolase
MTDRDYASALRIFGRLYPMAGYSGFFQAWLTQEFPEPYSSLDCVAAVRASPVGFAFPQQDEVLREAQTSAEVTHRDQHGIAGAQAVALAVHLGRRGASKTSLRCELSERFGYDLDRRMEDLLRDADKATTRDMVPRALIAFLEGEDYEEAVRFAVSLGGQTGTLACIAGGVAHAHYGSVPPEIVQQVRQRLPQDILQIVDDFTQSYGP